MRIILLFFLILSTQLFGLSNECDKILLETQLNNTSFDKNNEEHLNCTLQIIYDNVYGEDLPFETGSYSILKEVSWFKHFSLGMVYSYTYEINFSQFESKEIMEIENLFKSISKDRICRDDNYQVQKLMSRNVSIMETYNIDEIGHSFSFYFNKELCKAE